MFDLFLYQQLNALSEFELWDLLDREIPDSITQNLNPEIEHKGEHIVKQEQWKRIF